MGTSISEKWGSPETTVASISNAVAAIMASASDIPVFLIDPADNAIGTLTGIIESSDAMMGCRRIAASFSP